MRRLAEPLAWWVTLYGIYLGMISTISATELSVGAAAAGAGAAAAVAARRALLSAGDAGSYRPRLGWLRWLTPLPAQIVRDSARLARSGARGEFAELSLPADERAAARRGLASLAISTSPGTYVADADPDRDVLVVHRIGRHPSAVERRIGD
jgi:hypothetical protein